MSDYATAAAHVGAMREMLRQSSDDTNYTDELLYKLLLDARSLLLRRELDKHKPISKWNFQSYCIPLAMGEYHDCDCVPVSGCKVLKSTIPIPRPLRSMMSDIMYITTIDGIKRIPYKSVSFGKYQKYKNTGKNAPYYDINNEYLIVFNMPLTLKALLVTAVVEDPSELSNSALCTPSEEAGLDCYNVLLSRFPIDGHLVQAMYEVALKMIGVALKMGEDDTNDASNDNQIRV